MVGAESLSGYAHRSSRQIQLVVELFERCRPSMPFGRDDLPPEQELKL